MPYKTTGGRIQDSQQEPSARSACDSRRTTCLLARLDPHLTLSRTLSRPLFPRAAPAPPQRPPLTQVDLHQRPLMQRQVLSAVGVGVGVVGVGVGGGRAGAAAVMHTGDTGRTGRRRSHEPRATCQLWRLRCRTSAVARRALSPLHNRHATPRVTRHAPRTPHPPAAAPPPRLLLLPLLLLLLLLRRTAP